MNLRQSIYTETAECQDCYKCLRQCSVKAIKIEAGHAMIMPELCVSCGHCVNTCPVGAKRVRSDLERAQRLLQMKRIVIVSLAPSFVTEFDGIPVEKLIRAIRALGFYGVSETALGAQEVSASIADLLAQSGNSIYISSACPTAVELIKKYHHRYAPYITDMFSPVLAHCKLLRRRYGDDIGTVFIGPCIAKKTEADAHSDLLDVAITFEELRRWWEIAGIDPLRGTPQSDDGFIPEHSREGALYPIDGGMIAGIRQNCTVNDDQFMSFSGIRNIREALTDLDRLQPDKPLFIEALACRGGCVNGPRATATNGTVIKRRQVITAVACSNTDIPRRPTIDITAAWDIPPVEQRHYSEDDIRTALKRIGKMHRDDELNCSSCGYDSCRAFAVALLDGRAEPNMCAGYMRKISNQKANALLRTMPSGVVIVDDTMRIVECNRRFAQLLGPELLSRYESADGLEGIEIRQVLPFHWLFLRMLSRQKESFEADVRLGDAILHVTVFAIEAGRLIGGILQDITEPAVQKEQIINKARDVIAKNLATVQQIAFLLGENAADTEVILNSIVNSFTPESFDAPDKTRT